MTKAHTPTEMSKGQSDNTNNATKKFDYKAIGTDLGRSVEVTTATPLVWLTCNINHVSLLTMFTLSDPDYYQLSYQNMCWSHVQSWSFVTFHAFCVVVLSTHNKFNK